MKKVKGATSAGSLPLPPKPFAESGPETMRRWFEMKYLDDLSGIRPEQYGYYQHHVHHFVDSFFTARKIGNSKILDFGCGPGFYSFLLAERGAHVVGLDRDEFLIGKARETQAKRKSENVEFVLGDIASCSARWPYGEFDYILAIDVVVSFDYMRRRHAHREVVEAFQAVRRLLADEGRFYIVESHPFFGRVLSEYETESGERHCLRPADYRFEHRPPDYPNHWFTLDEMSKASCEARLAISRIYEPEPSAALAREHPGTFEFRVRYPGMIVYELCKMMGV